MVMSCFKRSYVIDPALPIETASFLPNHNPNTRIELKVNARPPAKAAPTTPISGIP